MIVYVSDASYFLFVHLITLLLKWYSYCNSCCCRSLWRLHFIGEIWWKISHPLWSRLCQRISVYRRISPCSMHPLPVNFFDDYYLNYMLTAPGNLLSFFLISLLLLTHSALWEWSSLIKVFFLRFLARILHSLQSFLFELRLFYFLFVALLQCT